MHAAAAVHATPVSWLLAAPAGFGVDWMFHTVPSHRSASVIWLLEPAGYEPTAVHAFEAVQATPVSAIVPPGLGVDCAVHVVPFHCIALVEPTVPTAVQALGDWHATPASEPLCAPGVDCTDHDVPSQPSANVPAA